MQYTVDQIPGIARSVLAELAERNTNTLALHGDLGAGKTTLVSAIAKELGIAEGIISPTFIVYRVYDIPQPSSVSVTWPHWKKLAHIDGYRLEGEEDAMKIRLHELFLDPQNLVCIEWPENVGAVVPTSALHATLTYTADNGRNIEYNN